MTLAELVVVLRAELGRWAKEAEVVWLWRERGELLDVDRGGRRPPPGFLVELLEHRLP